MKSQKRKDNQKFFDKWASWYDIKLFQLWAAKFHKPVLDGIKPATNILDVSCGTGELLNKIEMRWPRCTLYGVDISENMLTEARAKCSSAVTFQNAEVQHLSFPSNTFDLVTTTEAFHHYDNQPKALSEMVRVTKKNGRIIVVDINFFLRPIHALFETFEPGCVRVNSREEMKTLFKKAGLNIIEQKRTFAFALTTIGEKK